MQKKRHHLSSGEILPVYTIYIDKIDWLYPANKADDERLEYGLILCQNDTYEPNYPYDDKGEMFLID